jgi:hypothetical protein
MRDKDLQQLTEDIKKDWSETLGYKRFNRHEVFEPGDSSHILKLIGSIYGNYGIKNSLYGLFDGYWYNDLLEEISTVESITVSDIDKLKVILNKVDGHLSTVLTK